MLKLTLIGMGKKERLSAFAGTVTDEISALIKYRNGNIYNPETLAEAESSPELLLRNDIITFSADTDNEKSYIGVFAPIDYDILYQKLFSTANDESDYDCYYSKTELAILLRDMFFEPDKKEAEEEDIVDFKLGYRFSELESGKCLFTAEWKLCEYLSDINAKSIYDGIITRLDGEYPDVFLSAYISKAKEVESVPRKSYDENLLEKSILGIEYSFYVSHNIFKNNLLYGEAVNLYSAEKLKNGFRYEYKNGISDFSYGKVDSVTECFDGILIPYMIMWNWSKLQNCDDSFIPEPDTVSVYMDDYNFNNPDIVFSYGLTYEMLDRLMQNFCGYCSARFNLKR